MLSVFMEEKIVFQQPDNNILVLFVQIYVQLWIKSLRLFIFYIYL